MTSPAQNRAIHGLKKQIAGFTDDDYRALLKARFKAVSSRDLTDFQARALIDDLKGLAGQAGGARTPARKAQGKYAPILQALWLAGWNFGIVRDKDDAALIAFVQRQSGIAHVRFLTDHRAAQKAIEALKSWIAREGGVVWPKDGAARQRKLAVIVAQENFMRKKLQDFRAENFGMLEGLPAKIESYADAQLDILSRKIGVIVRRTR